MSESLFPPFLKWGDYASEDSKKPDKIKIKVKDLETFETEFSANVTAFIEKDGKWDEINIPLKSHESKNGSLLDQWNRAVKSGKIKEGMELVIKTHKAKSKNNRNIRRYSLEKI